jgi:hypothetical protein
LNSLREEMVSSITKAAMVCRKYCGRSVMRGTKKVERKWEGRSEQSFRHNTLDDDALTAVNNVATEFYYLG